MPSTILRGLNPNIDDISSIAILATRNLQWCISLSIERLDVHIGCDGGGIVVSCGNVIRSITIMIYSTVS